jgi:hypothetical protein
LESDYYPLSLTFLTGTASISTSILKKSYFFLNPTAEKDFSIRVHPTISSVSIDKSYDDGGNPLIIYGKGFSKKNLKVFIGNQECIIKSVIYTKIECETLTKNNFKSLQTTQNAYHTRLFLNKDIIPVLENVKTFLENKINDSKNNFVLPSFKNKKILELKTETVLENPYIEKISGGFYASVTANYVFWLPTKAESFTFELKEGTNTLTKTKENYNNLNTKRFAYTKENNFVYYKYALQAGKIYDFEIFHVNTDVFKAFQVGLHVDSSSFINNSYLNFFEIEIEQNEIIRSLLRINAFKNFRVSCKITENNATAEKSFNVDLNANDASSYLNTELKKIFEDLNFVIVKIPIDANNKFRESVSPDFKCLNYNYSFYSYTDNSEKWKSMRMIYYDVSSYSNKIRSFLEEISASYLDPSRSTCSGYSFNIFVDIKKSKFLQSNIQQCRVSFDGGISSINIMLAQAGSEDLSGKFSFNINYDGKDYLVNDIDVQNAKSDIVNKLNSFSVLKNSFDYFEITKKVMDDDYFLAQIKFKSQVID